MGTDFLVRNLAQMNLGIGQKKMALSDEMLKRFFMCGILSLTFIIFSRSVELQQGTKCMEPCTKDVYKIDKVDLDNFSE